MKILAAIRLSEKCKVEERADSRLPANNNGLPANDNGLPANNLLIWPDSCVLQSNRPLYIPDFDDKFFALPAIGFKSGRLGKCVAPKFSIRYFCGFSAALIILSQHTLQNLKEGVQPAFGSVIFDNALVIGENLPLPSNLEKLTLQDSISILNSELPEKFKIEVGSNARNIRNGIEGHNGKSADVFTGQPDAEAAIRTLSAASATNTIKTGDFILSPLTGVSPIELRQGLEIKISIAENQLMLQTRFK